jgi:hypothetical protein
LIGLTSSTLVFLSNPTTQTCVLLLLTIWSFCRLYYFAFYVIEKYLDPTFRFSGLGAVLNYLLRKKQT